MVIQHKLLFAKIFSFTNKSIHENTDVVKYFYSSGIVDTHIFL